MIVNCICYQGNVAKVLQCHGPTCISTCHIHEFSLLNWIEQKFMKALKMVEQNKRKKKILWSFHAILT
jgi:hypothetical protein